MWGIGVGKMKDSVLTDEETRYCRRFIFVLVLGSFLLSSGVAVVSADGLSNYTALVPGYNGTDYTFLGSYSSGEVIINESGSYYLTDDLNSSPYKYGILIQGEGITLDGNGKSLTGSSATESSIIGIMGTENSNYATITNFSQISNSYYGMRLEGNYSLVDGNTATNNGYMGICVVGERGKIINNTVFGNYNGIFGFMNSSRYCVVMNNTAYQNTYMGIYTGGDSSLIYRNRAFQNSRYGIMTGGADCGGINPSTCGYGYYSNISGNLAYENGMYGIYSCEPSERVIDNTVYDNYQAGIMVRSRLNVSVNDNVLTNNSIGIRTTYSSQYNVTMTGNSIQKSSQAGILVDGTYTKPGNFTIYNNKLTNNQNVFINDSTSCFTWTHPMGPVSGINVMGGPYLAGNYWSSPDGTGWSDLQDPKETGYSQTPYEVVSGSGSFDTAPLIRVALIINGSHDDWTIMYPNGNISYPRYSNATYIAQAKPGADLLNVSVNDTYVGPVSSWTFSNITTNHMISSYGRPTPGQVQAFFTLNATWGPVPLTVAFTNQSLGNPTSFLWNFGDGSSSALENPIYTYKTPGTYTVSLRAINDYTGGMATLSNAVTVTSGVIPSPTPTPIPGEITAAFEADLTSGTAPMQVSFTDHSTGNPVSWFWYLGDGSVSTSQNITHIYQVPGTYSVRLSAQNSISSANIEKTEYIRVK